MHVSAYAFGEECRAASGETSFLAMETDFRIRVPVDSLSNKEEMGRAVLQAMAAIETLPSEQLPGTRPGRVEFEFAAADSQSLRIIIDITRFRQEAGGLQGAELLQQFQASP
jgi:hypothetical protein